MLHVSVLTLFPEMFPGPLGSSLAGKSINDKWQLDVINIRDFAKDKHATVDDTPYGGGAGMLMRPDVIADAIDSVTINHQTSTINQKLIYMSPRGRVLTQPLVDELLTYDKIVILCGRYEGVDERVLEEYDIEEVSIGDFVLSGGEIAAMALIDACVRQVFGVLGNQETFSEESFARGKFENLLEYPHYTRPAEWKGRKVPEVLLSGNHGEINKWRLAMAEKMTKTRRPDLWDKYKAKK